MEAPGRDIDLDEDSQVFLPKIARNNLNTSRAEETKLPDINGHLNRNSSVKQLPSPSNDSITKRLKRTLKNKRNSDVKAVGHKMDELA